MQLLVHNYKSYSTIRKHFCLWFTTCALSHKKQFTDFWQNNYALQYLVCLIKGYLQIKKSNNEKKEKKTSSEDKLNPGHQTPTTPRSPLDHQNYDFVLYFARNKALELHYKSPRFSFIAKFAENLCQVTRKKLFTDFARNNFDFHCFVLSDKTMPTKKSIKRKKKGKKLLQHKLNLGHQTARTPRSPLDHHSYL